MSVGGPPGVTGKAKVVATGPKVVAFEFEKEEDAAYFKSDTSGALAFWPNGGKPHMGHEGEDSQKS
jgi:hypothetical protein